VANSVTRRPALAWDPEADPFGPWEYVEAGDLCRGHGDGCMWSRCTGRESTCRCCCPVCLGETPEDYGFDGDW
jgi:hypothetical protein